MIGLQKHRMHGMSLDAHNIKKRYLEENYCITSRNKLSWFCVKSENGVKYVFFGNFDARWRCMCQTLAVSLTRYNIRYKHQHVKFCRRYHNFPLILTDHCY